MKAKFTVAALALTAALVACPGTQSARPANRADINPRAGQALTASQTTATTVNTDLSDFWTELNAPPAATSPGVSQLAAPGMLSALARNLALHPQIAPRAVRALGKVAAQIVVSTPLETGVYDCTSGTCPATADTSSGTQDLIFKWNTLHHGVATLTYDWDASTGGAASAPVNTYNGSDVNETPTKSIVRLDVGTTNVARLNLAATWHGRTGQPGQFILAPDNLALSGFLQDFAGVQLVNLDHLTLSETSGYATTGKISLNDGTNSASFDWDIAVNGTITRDADGFPDSNFTADTVNFNVGVSNNADSARLQFDADQFVTTGSDPSARLSNGVFTVNQQMVTFEGTLNDSNHNCVPGENVTVHYADGTATLEDFLLTDGGEEACTSV